MRALETSISRPQPSRIFGCLRGSKGVLSDWRPLETSFSRPHQISIFWWFSRQKMKSNCYGNTRKLACRLQPSRKFGGQEAENVFKLPFEQ